MAVTSRATILPMPTDQILDLLISERDKLNRAIAALQGTSRDGTPRRNVRHTTSAAPTLKHTRKRRWTAAMREAARERAKAVWVRRRKQAAKKG